VTRRATKGQRRVEKVVVGLAADLPPELTAAAPTCAGGWLGTAGQGVLPEAKARRGGSLARRGC
jgi:hypothetical protein